MKQKKIQKLFFLALACWHLITSWEIEAQETANATTILMEYEAWHGPTAHKIRVDAPIYPLLYSSNMQDLGRGYDSKDEAVIEQHYRWLLDMDVDGIILDHTNNVACTFTPDSFNQEIPALIVAQYVARDRSFSPEYQTYFSILGWFEKISNFAKDSAGDRQLLQFLQGALGCRVGDSFQIAMATIKSNNKNIFRLFDKFGKKYGKFLKIVVLAGGYEPTAWESLPSRGNVSAMDLQMEFYRSLYQRYSNLAVMHEGKPLYLSYFGAPTARGLFPHLETRQNWVNWSFFTLRKMGGYLSNQLELPGFLGIGRLGLPRFEQLWTWIDRLRANPAVGNDLGPSYAVTPDNAATAEAFTVTMANPAPEGWGDFQSSLPNPNGDLRQNGQTFKNFMKLARSLHPKFLLINQFNEFAWPDQGWDEETTNDIEPTNIWGAKYLDIVRDEIIHYRDTTGSTLPDRQELSPIDATAHTSLLNWPVEGVLDNDVFTVYSSDPIFNVEQLQEQFLAAWLPATAGHLPYQVVGLRLQARYSEGVTYGFPSSYRIYLTSADNAHWDYLGSFTQQPTNGWLEIDLKNLKGTSIPTWGVLIVPDSLDPQNAAGPYFQMAGIKFIITD